ncbi:hypothetical protein ABBQ38_002862 [Trebouxia sp. C0009 RCD-2024]
MSDMPESTSSMVCLRRHGCPLAAVLSNVVTCTSPESAGYQSLEGTLVPQIEGVADR